MTGPLDRLLDLLDDLDGGVTADVLDATCDTVRAIVPPLETLEEHAARAWSDGLDALADWMEDE